MDIVINTNAIKSFFALPPDELFLAFMLNFGWIIAGIFFIFAVLELYLFYIRNKWASGHKFTLLAIDIPKGNEQTPKAVENMFTYLAGAHGGENFFEKWFEGKFQKSFSYEIVSLEGYTQFLIRTPKEFRDLIESSIYSQYPDAEISEVDDYTDIAPKKFPDQDYDIWGTEFIQTAPGVYPIKCYEEFEHSMGPSETQFKDPMATLMDLCGSLRQGEQLWMQFIITPTGFDWVDKADAEIDNVLGKKPKAKTGLFMKFLQWMGDLSEVIYSIWGDIEEKDSDDKSKTMFDLTPKDQKKIEALTKKSTKLAFEVKTRVVYIALKDVMNKAKVANGMVGYMKQFTALDLNGLRPDVKNTMTKAVYFFRNSRLKTKQNNLLNAYIDRSSGVGASSGLFNIEELATLWHFPLEASVRASLMQKTEGRKADAPSSLPLESQIQSAPDSLFADRNLDDIFIEDKKEESNNSNINYKKEDKKGNSEIEAIFEDISYDDEVKKTSAPPSNLPFV